MFCPTINGECVAERGERCRDWDSEQGVCRVQAVMIASLQSTKQQDEWIRQSERNRELDVKLAEHRFLVLMRILLTPYLQNPDVEEGTKEAIRQVIQSPSAEVAERLLRDAGLLD